MRHVGRGFANQRLSMCLAMGALLLFAPPARGQDLLETLDAPGANPGALFGTALAGLHDITGDSIPEVAVGAPGLTVGSFTGQGRVFFYSIATGALIRVLDDPYPQTGAQFGASLAVVGDLNGDSVPDLAVGAPSQDVSDSPDQGQVFVFSGSGGLIRTLDAPSPQAGSLFGFSLSKVGDVNGDSVPDIAVGSPRRTAAGNAAQGQAYVYSGADGSVLLTLDDPAPLASAQFGTSLAGLGDANGDSVPDLAVGAPFQSVLGNASQGQVFVFSGVDGALIRTVDNPTPQGNADFGYALARVNDLDGDSISDLAVGAPRQDVGGSANQGAGFVFSGASGLLVRTYLNLGLESGARLGFSIADAGDVNGDSFSDIAMGANLQNAAGFTDSGQAFVYSGSDGTLFRTLYNPEPQTGGQYGFAVAGVGNVGGDSRPDVAIGAPRLTALGSTTQGRVFVVSASNPAFTASIAASTPTPSQGSTIAACVHIDSGARSLGSYGATLSWNPSVLRFLMARGGDGVFASPVVNLTQVDAGTLSFADADPAGATGSSFVLCAQFAAVGPTGSSSVLNLELTSLFEAVTFENLIPMAQETDERVSITPGCTVGDVNDDGAINSGDALIILSFEVSLPIPSLPASRIAVGCGDANGDGATNSTDANIVLSYEVGLPINPAFPLGRSNVTSDSCSDACTSLPLAAMSGSAISLAQEGEVAFDSARQQSAAEGARLHPEVAAAAAGASITPRFEGLPRRLKPGQEFEFGVGVDLSRGLRLGSYGAVLRWNPALFELVQVSGGRTPGFETVVSNPAGAASGELRFASASPAGAERTVELARVRMRAVQGTTRLRGRFTLEMTSLAAPGPEFGSLLHLYADPR